MPDKKAYAPQYGDYAFEWEDRVDDWFHLVSGIQGAAPIKINQDANIYVTEISEGKALNFEISEDRQAYLVLIEGEANINGESLNARDALEIIGESIRVQAAQKAHILLVEMKQP
jgi:hypothetical protein